MRSPPHCSAAKESVAAAAPDIWVLAGINGAGKSSIGGEMLRRAGLTWYDPDRAAAELLESNGAFDSDEANAIAWRKGFEMLQKAIGERRRYLFETTLGGNTITATLITASQRGLAVRVWYCGLDSVDRHLSRIARRVREGGHDIPEALVRSRYNSSRMNLIRLLPHLTELRVLDNSAERKDPRRAKPRVLLHLLEGELLDLAEPAAMPDWAKPIVGAALS